MTQALAILVDAYRELNARKLFWITLVISLMVVIVYGSIGFDETGVSMMYGLWHVESEFIRAGTPWAKVLYLGIFSEFIVGLWLAWAATILAIISTTSIFPEFVAGGSIDLVLSKPIGRLRLFVMKYFSGLLFVLLQVAVFCLGVFLCVGLRMGEWKWMVFAAIPLVTVFFSYLYAVNVLVGTWTRSALAALLVTLLFWFSLFSLQAAESLLSNFKWMSEIQIEQADKSIARINDRAAEVAATTQPSEAFVRRTADQIQLATDRKAEAQESLATLTRWHGPIDVVTNLLPKTDATIGLLTRWFKEDEKYSIMAMLRGEMQEPPGETIESDADDDQDFSSRRRQDAEVSRRAEKEMDSVSAWWIIGSSLAFEAVIFGLAAWIFCRRDF